jgi:hypothetical protein
MMKPREFIRRNEQSFAVTSVVNAIYDEYPNADSISSGERRSTTTEGQYREREREEEKEKEREKSEKICETS